MWEGDFRLEPYFLEPTERTERTKRTTRENENRQAVKKKQAKTEKTKTKHSPDRPLKKEEKDQETGSRQIVGKSEEKNQDQLRLTVGKSRRILAGKDPSVQGPKDTL